MTHIFRLGETYTDLISGFTGIAVIRYTNLDGRTLIDLASKVTEKGSLKSHESFDSTMLRSESGETPVLLPVPESEIVLGRVYRDELTDFVGTATTRADHVNGCVQFGLEPRVDEKGERRKGYLFDDSRLVDVMTREKASVTAPRGSADLAETRPVYLFDD